MFNIYFKICEFFQHFKRLYYMKKYNLLQKKYKKSLNKIFLPALSTEISFNTKNEILKKDFEKNLQTLLIELQSNPKKMIKFIKENNTKVYVLDNPNKILKFINEEKGFISPLRGLNALFLNMVLFFTKNEKFSLSLSTKPLLVLTNEDIQDEYFMLHHFYKWYAYKCGRLSSEFNAQAKLKQLLHSKKQTSISKMSVKEILSVKEAINKDVEAIDFVFNFSRSMKAKEAS